MLAEIFPIACKVEMKFPQINTDLKNANFFLFLTVNINYISLNTLSTADNFDWKSPDWRLPILPM